MFRRSDYRSGGVVDRHLRDIGRFKQMADQQSFFPGIPRVRDKVPPLTEFGDYVKMSDIEGEPVKIVAIEVWRGEGDPSFPATDAWLVACEDVDGKKMFLICAQQVVYEKLKRVREDLPIVATFFKPEDKRYYDVE